MESAKICFCARCGALGARQNYICEKCRVKLIETDMRCCDYLDEARKGKGDEFLDELRKKYVLSESNHLLDKTAYDERDQKEKAKRKKDLDLIHKYETTIHCPRCWSFNVKETFVSSIITGLFFSATPTWFCNNCHFKWKQ